MSQLVRNPTRTPSSQRRRLLLVRQPVRSVRAPDSSDHLPVRLALGVIVGLGTMLVVWLIGHLGLRLGFAPLVWTPDLGGHPADGLAAGTMLLIAIPRMIFEAGLRAPGWLMLGFVMIALPAASLGAARPATPGGPRPKAALQALSMSGAVLALLASAALIWWTTSSVRLTMLRPMPMVTGAFVDWHVDLLTTAGLDTLAVITASVWVVLVFRLPIPRWLRALAASGSLFTLVVVIVAMAISGTTATQIGAGRSVSEERGRMLPALVLGSTPHRTALLLIEGDRVSVVLEPEAPARRIDGRLSIVDFAAANVEPTEE